MNIEEYKKSLKAPLRDRTLMFLKRNDEVVIGFKKRGFGKDNYLGIGGKVEQGESKEEAVAREVREEIGVEVQKLEYHGYLDFYFPEVIDESWNQRVHVFASSEWTGEPTETEEIKPFFFKFDRIPYDKMWDDNKVWLPKVLSGEYVAMEFLFDKDLKVMEYKDIR